MCLSNAVGLVAGASGGIGRAIAFELLGADTEVMLGRSMAKLVQPAPAQDTRGKCHFVVADLTDDGAVRRVAGAPSERSRLDFLILSSGMYERSCDPAVFLSGRNQSRRALRASSAIAAAANRGQRAGRVR